MKSKKWAIIVSLIIMGISVLIFSILNFRLYPVYFKNWLLSFMTPTDLHDWKNFFVVISSGAFTSSIVTLLISIAEYRVERESALEDFIEANMIFCGDFYNMEYLNIDMPIELLKRYYSEQWHKPIEAALGRSKQGYIYEGEYIVADSETEAKIKDWIWNCSLSEETRKMYAAPHEKKEYLDAEFERTLQKYAEQMDAVMKQYIDLNDKISSRRLTTTIAKIDFLFGNKYRKEVLHKKMYSRNRELIEKINHVSSHLKDCYKAPVDDRGLALCYIQEIQDYMFLVKEKNKGYTKTVYNKYLFEMKCEIDNALRRLYGKKKYHDEPPQEKDFLVFAIWRKNDELDEDKGMPVGKVNG